MSLARQALSVSRRATLVALPQQRYASTSHGHHEDSHHHGSEEFPAESFVTPFWRNTLIATGLAVAAYKYAPEPNDNVYLTRWIAMYTTARETWFDLNVLHTAQQLEFAENTLLFNDAQKPTVYRYRYPQALSRGSPFLKAVGTQVDMSNVHVKN